MDADTRKNEVEEPGRLHLVSAWAGKLGSPDTSKQVGMAGLGKTEEKPFVLESWLSAQRVIKHLTDFKT